MIVWGEGTLCPSANRISGEVNQELSKTCGVRRRRDDVSKEERGGSGDRGAGQRRNHIANLLV